MNILSYFSIPTARLLRIDPCFKNGKASSYLGMEYGCITDDEPGETKISKPYPASALRSRLNLGSRIPVLDKEKLDREGSVVRFIW